MKVVTFVAGKRDDLVVVCELTHADHAFAKLLEFAGRELSSDYSL